MSTTRFAPSPTGFLHLGHAFSALFAARHGGERFLLRLEDIDATRCRPEYAAATIEDLQWLGLGWHGGVRVQSQHLADYTRVLNDLRARGLLYPCFCSRAEIAGSVAAPHGPDGAPLYPGTCRGLDSSLADGRIAAGAAHGWRLDMAKALGVIGRHLSYEELGHGTIDCDPAAWGDVVLARKDVPTSYHLCVTHDDALQGVDLVTRGVDLQHATDVQRVLQELMGWNAPRYAHHRLMLGPDGKRWAKRDRAQTIKELRESGSTAEDVVKMLEF
jgi:glutamyl-Q tRNA(Asp) synthetase